MTSRLHKHPWRGKRGISNEKFTPLFTMTQRMVTAGFHPSVRTRPTATDCMTWRAMWGSRKGQCGGYQEHVRIQESGCCTPANPRGDERESHFPHLT